MQIALIVPRPPDFCNSINPLTDPYCAATALRQLLAVAVNVMIIIAALSSLIFLLSGGIKYIMAGDNAKNLEIARTTIIYSALGLVVATSAYLILTLLKNGWPGFVPGL